MVFSHKKKRSDGGAPSLETSPHAYFEFYYSKLQSESLPHVHGWIQKTLEESILDTLRPWKERRYLFYTLLQSPFRLLDTFFAFLHAYFICLSPLSETVLEIPWVYILMFNFHREHESNTVKLIHRLETTYISIKCRVGLRKHQDMIEWMTLFSMSPELPGSPLFYEHIMLLTIFHFLEEGQLDGLHSLLMDYKKDLVPCPLPPKKRSLFLRQSS